MRTLFSLMPKAWLRLLPAALAVGIMSFISPSVAADEKTATPNPDSAGINADNVLPDKVMFPGVGHSLWGTHFTWGAEAGASLDMTSQDLSTFDLDAFLGYKNPRIKVLGVGAGIHRAVHTGSNLIPVYALFRSSFRSKPSLCFLQLQAGYSFNSIVHAKSRGDVMGSVGVGINLQQAKLAQSYVLLSLNCNHFSDRTIADTPIDRKYVLFARLAIGVGF